jgi:hypothetical protein
MSDAEARLKAAAPALLAALQDLLSETIPTFDNRHEIASAVDAIDEAIGDTDWRKGWKNLIEEDEEDEDEDE